MRLRNVSGILARWVRRRSCTLGASERGTDVQALQVASGLFRILVFAFQTAMSITAARESDI